MFLQLILGAVLLFERNRGLRSKGTNLLFWTGMLGYGTIKLRSLILRARDMVGVVVSSLKHLESPVISKKGDVEDVFRFVTFSIEYLIIILEFSLALLPEPQSQLQYQPGDDQSVSGVVVARAESVD